MCFEYQGIKFNGKKVLKLLNAYGQSRGGLTPPLTISLTVKYFLKTSPMYITKKKTIKSKQS